MEYAESLRGVLLRKIDKAERDLMQLKLDYCRFVFGLSHRTQVESGGQRYQVRSVNVATMERLENGEFSRPDITGVPLGEDGRSVSGEPVELGQQWQTLGVHDGAV